MRERLKTPVAVLLAVWVAAGLFVSVQALAPILEARLADAKAPTVGVPTTFTPAVLMIQRLIPYDTARTGGWLVILPAEASPTQVQYVHQQLAYLEYPRAGYVVTAAENRGQIPAGQRYVIAFRGIQLPPSWSAVVRAGEFVRYRRQP